MDRVSSVSPCVDLWFSSNMTNYLFLPSEEGKKSKADERMIGYSCYNVVSLFFKQKIYI